MKKSLFAEKGILCFCALLCCALWGSAFPAIKIGYKLLSVTSMDYGSQLLFAGVRFFFAGILTIVFGSLISKKILLINRKNIKSVGVLSLFQTIIQYSCFYIGLAFTSGVSGSVIDGSSTLFALLIAAIIFKSEKLDVKKIIGCAIGFSGVIVINVSGEFQGDSFIGDGLILISAVSYAFSSAFSKEFSKKESPVLLSGWQFILGGIVLSVIGFFAGGKLNFQSLSVVLLLCYLSFLSAFAYTLWGILLKYNEVSSVTVYGFMIPIFGSVMSAIFSDEKSILFSIKNIIALFLVCIGILIVTLVKKEKQIKDYVNCKLCPRKCGVNRYKTNGVCGMGAELKAARAALHFYEEPCISGKEGSGAVFFSGCNMKCVFCQNRNISFSGEGKNITIKRLSKIFIELQKKGANNINLVTPTHFSTSIIKAVKSAKQKGLKLPIVYNTSGYENANMIEKLKETVDVFLTDFKYFSSNTADYSKAPDYPLIAKAALKEMYKTVGMPEFNENGIMTKGIIVRVLCLPNHVDEAKQIIEYLYNEYKDNIFISIMNQYTPNERVKDDKILCKPLSNEEYEDILDFAENLGIENAFIQEGGTVSESFVPEWNGEGI